MNNNTADYSNCIIEVVKKSRSKYMKPQVGMILYTVYNYTNAWNTEKLVCINEEGKEFQATLKSIKFLESEDPEKSATFQKKLALSSWIEKTHIPIIFKPVSLSRNKSSYKCKLSHPRISISHNTWITTRVVRDDSGEPYDKYVLNKFQTAYIPLWYANKIGLMLKAKNN